MGLDPNVHIRDVEVGWGHCDPAGIVFYPNFYQWFDEATHALLTARGVGHRYLAATFGIVGCGLIDTGATFKAPARFGDMLQIESRVSEMTNRTFRVEHVLSRNGVEICSGYEVRGCFVEDAAAPNGLKAIRVPEELRAALS